MKIYFLFIGILILCCTSGYSQKSKKDTLKNRFEFFYAPAITKAYLERDKVDIINDPGNPIEYYAPIIKPTEPVYGYSLGFKYHKEISKNKSFSFGLAYAQKGLKTKIFQNTYINPSNPDTPDILVYYRYRLHTWQIPLQFYYKPFIKNKKNKSYKNDEKWFSNIYFNLNLVPDIYKNFLVECYFTEAGQPFARESDGASVTEGYFYNPYIIGMAQNVFLGLFRMGVGGGTGIDFKISKNFIISAGINLMYYTNMIGQYSTAVPGDAYTADLSLSIGYIFDQKYKKGKNKKHSKKRK